MSFAPELTVLGYVTDPTRRRVLLVHRIARSSDEQLGKYNGLGGKVEPGEDIVAAMRRELMEEAAIDATDLELRGTVSWPGFNGRDVFGFVFLITGFTGAIPDSNEEGTLAWHDVATMMRLPMWDGTSYRSCSTPPSHSSTASSPTTAGTAPDGRSPRCRVLALGLNEC